MSSGWTFDSDNLCNKNKCDKNKYWSNDINPRDKCINNSDDSSDGSS